MFPGLKRIFIVREAASSSKQALGYEWRARIEAEELEAQAKRIFGIGRDRDGDYKVVNLIDLV
jgi:hypothetical protein